MDQTWMDGLRWIRLSLLLLMLFGGCSDRKAGNVAESEPSDSRGTGEVSSGNAGEPMTDLTEPPIDDTGEMPATAGGEPADITAEMPPIVIPQDGAPAASTPAERDPEGGSTDHVPGQTIRRSGVSTDHRGYSPERVFFATNREPERSPDSAADPDLFFSGDRGDLSYGIVEVSIPYKRQPGTLPEPSVLRLEFSQDPSKHVVLMEIERLPDAEFWKALRIKVEQSSEKQLFVFIHGYCATFRDAARRTAQMAYDINYQGPSMFFSWPAGSDTESFEVKANYLKDLRRAEQSDDDLITVLEGISRYSGATKIHLVAHSMGNFVLTEALKTMDDRRGAAVVQTALFDQVALAAPDIDAREFVERVGLRLKPFSRRFTVYASAEDKALYVSRKVNDFEPLGYLNQYSRSGAKKQMFDLVDASQLSTGWFDSGHIYYGDMPEMIADVSFVFRGIQASSLQRGLAETPPMFRLTRRGP